ncbi:argininosuccinate synthase [Desulfocucumis palustris]|uniref:argininosuccinate synthase n=1 Tax=Desulfocucumis palustris TaxID=1898651 RepID=A0A2L2X9B5_9FIRM|nr:argininosuccinate synthase [Desulfocucumis palustris]
MWFSPLREALDAFVDVTQRMVTGTVRMKQYKDNCTPVGTTSPYSLYNEDLATFGRDEVYSQADVCRVHQPVRAAAAGAGACAYGKKSGIAEINKSGAG